MYCIDIQTRTNDIHIRTNSFQHIRRDSFSTYSYIQTHWYKLVDTNSLIQTRWYILVQARWYILEHIHTYSNVDISISLSIGEHPGTAFIQHLYNCHKCRVFVLPTQFILRWMMRGAEMEWKRRGKVGGEIARNWVFDIYVGTSVAS